MMSIPLSNHGPNPLPLPYRDHDPEGGGLNILVPTGFGNQPADAEKKGIEDGKWYGYSRGGCITPRWRSPTGSLGVVFISFHFGKPQPMS